MKKLSNQSKFTTIEVESAIDPGVYYPRVGKIIRTEVFGFNTAGGGWSSMGGHPGDTPAKFLIFKPTGRRKLQAIAVERIKGKF